MQYLSYELTFRVYRRFWYPRLYRIPRVGVFGPKFDKVRTVLYKRENKYEQMYSYGLLLDYTIRLAT